MVDAAFPIFATNVAHPTPPVNARNPHAPPLSSLARNSPLRLTLLPITPVTPVRVDRLDFLLVTTKITNAFSLMALP